MYERPKVTRLGQQVHFSKWSPEKAPPWVLVKSLQQLQAILIITYCITYETASDTELAAVTGLRGFHGALLPRCR